MTLTQRLRLTAGMLAVLALTAVLVLVFNQRQSQALSVTGQVITDQAAVGAAYGGVVVKQLAKEVTRSRRASRSSPSTAPSSSGTSPRASRSPRPRRSTSTSRPTP